MQSEKPTPRPCEVGEAPHYTLAGEWHRRFSVQACTVELRRCVSLNVSAVWPFVELGRAWRVAIRYGRSSPLKTLAVVADPIAAGELFLEADQAMRFTASPWLERRAARLDLERAFNTVRAWRRMTPQRRTQQPARRRFRVTV